MSNNTLNTLAKKLVSTLMIIITVFSVYCIDVKKAQAATYFSDDFGSDYGELSTHTPTSVGTSWTQLIDNGVDLYVQSYNQHVNVQANTTNAGSFYTADGTYSTADYEITMNLAFSGGSGSYTRSIAVRVQDANNMYLLRFGSSVFELYKRVSGTWSLIGSQSSSYPAGNTSSFPYTGDQVGLKALGTEISASINGSTVLTVTDSSISAAGKAGIGLGYVNISTDDGGTGVGIDNVAVNSVTSDVTAPTVSTLSPADGATGVEVDSDLVIEFSESVDAESGDIVIYKSDGSEFETIDVTGGQVTGSGSDTITINPSSDFSKGTSYYVQIDATAFDDASSNSFAGISDSTTWNFRTRAAGGNSKILTNPSEPSIYVQSKTGNLILDGAYSGKNIVTDSVGFEYWTDDSDNKEVVDFSGSTEYFEYRLNNVDCDTEYNIRSFAKNSIGTTYSDTISIDTESCSSLDEDSDTDTDDSDTDDSDTDTDTTGVNDEKVDEDGDDLTEDDSDSNIEIRDFEIGIEGDDVKKLQEILININSGPAALELKRVGPTNFFGRYTQNALGEYQKIVGILPHAGYFGPITREYMKTNSVEGVWW